MTCMVISLLTDSDKNNESVKNGGLADMPQFRGGNPYF